MAKSKKNRVGVVYSTSDNYTYTYNNQPQSKKLAPEEQLLYVSRDKKNRKGKEATLVEGFIGPEDELKELAKILKTKCGVGGNAKDDYIVIQGDKRSKVKEILESAGYKVKMKGG